VDFWDRRSQYWVIIRQIMGQNEVIFLGKEKLKLGQNKTNYGTKQDDILGQEKFILDHIEMNFGSKRGVFLGQEKSSLSHNKTNYGT
jgi:hypothetical protein